MSVRNFFCFCIGTVTGLGIAMWFRDQNALLDPSDWVYGLCIVAGGVVALTLRLLLDRIWKPEP